MIDPAQVRDLVGKPVRATVGSNGIVIGTLREIVNQSFRIENKNGAVVRLSAGLVDTMERVDG